MNVALRMAESEMEKTSDLLSHRSGLLARHRCRTIDERLIVALDVESEEKAVEVVDRLGPQVTFYKIGLQLLTIGGIKLADRLRKKHKHVFLDYKLFDIGVTVRNAIASIRAHSDVDFLTVQGDEEVLHSAAQAVENSDVGILAVTVPTTWDVAYLEKLGIPKSVEELVLLRAKFALDTGCLGVIASGREAAAIRARFGDNLLIVTPGIRLAGSPLDDQRRASTPAQAIGSGADYLVVGRPIVAAPDPAFAAASIIEEMRQAYEQREFRL